MIHAFNHISSRIQSNIRIQGVKLLKCIPVMSPLQYKSLPYMNVRYGPRNYPIKLICRNQKIASQIRGNVYEVKNEWEVGIVLESSEVKSCRAHNVDLSAAFADFYNNELYIYQMHIPVWRHGLIGRPDPNRARKLLAHRSELRKMQQFLQKGANSHLFPLRMEVGQTGWLKIILAECIKQKTIDTRRKEEEREMKRQLRDW